MASSCSDSVMHNDWTKLSNDDKLYAATQLNETDKNRENSIAEIRNWIKEKNDGLLRGQLDDFLILRFLRVCKFDLEKTKIRIRNHYEQRSDLPGWYMNKDPFLPELQELLDMGFASMYKTINVIHRKHKMSSKRSEKAGVGGIYQRDMAITQFAFIGYVLIVPKSIGLCNNPQEEEALNHFWRVIGHMLQIPD